MSQASENPRASDHSGPREDGILLQRVGWELDHIGHAVRSVDNSARELAALGFRAGWREQLVEQGIDLAFLTLGDSTVELLAPLQTTGEPTANETPIAKFLRTRGPGLHHLCYRVPSLEDALNDLAREGIQLVDRVPRVGARGHLVAFLRPAGGILIELCGNR